jgi:hypothetical protein
MRTYTQARTILPVLFTLSDRRVAASLASPGVGKGLSGQVCHAKGIIEVSKGEQTSVGRDPRTWNSSFRRGSNVTRRAASLSSPAAPFISSPADASYSLEG